MDKPANANGCYDRPPFATHTYVQDGWAPDAEGLSKLQARLVKRIPVRFEDNCMYDNKATDPRCAGCKHINWRF